MASAAVTSTSVNLSQGQPPSYLTFSGGGWNSHSLLAGLLAGSLDGQAAKQGSSSINNLLGGFNGIAANSGGSWFLSHLAYSAPFLAGLEGAANRDQYNSTGYNGQVAALFNATTPQPPEWLKSLLALLPDTWRSNLATVQYLIGLAGAASDAGLTWRNFTDKFVYQPYGMLSELGAKGFDAPRLSWAAAKDLVISASAQTTPAVLNSIGLLQNKIFSATPLRSATAPPQGQMTPVALVSRAAKAGSRSRTAATYLAGDVNLDLTNNKWLSRQPSIRTPVAARLGSRLSVVDATTASSSAMAHLATPQTFASSATLSGLRNTLASGLRGLSPLASLAKGNLCMPKQLPSVPSKASTEATMKAYSDAGITRLADGGFSDNTAAAYMLRHIQSTKGTKTPFKLTMLMNSSIDPVTGIKMQVGPKATDLSSFWVPSDVANLFGSMTGPGADGPLVTFDAIGGFKVPVPSAKVFDPSAWQGEKPEWTYSKGPIDMAYYDLNVKTVANPSFGVVGGQSGQVRLFVSNNKASNAAPVLQPILSQYADNYTTARDAIANEGGFQFMQSALDLPL
jgi:hypothetical protein